MKVILATKKLGKLHQKYKAGQLAIRYGIIDALKKQIILIEKDCAKIEKIFDNIPDVKEHDPKGQALYLSTEFVKRKIVPLRRLGEYNLIDIYNGLITKYDK